MSLLHFTDYIMFTFDEQGNIAIPQPAHLVAVRTARYKLAKYIDYAEQITGIKPYYEMYDMQNDKNEVNNLAAPGKKRTAVQEAEFTKLKILVEKVQKERLKPIRRENDVNLKQMNITRLASPKVSNGAVYRDTGTIMGKPIGEAYFNMNTTITSTRNGTASGQLIMWSNQGIIRGKSVALSFTNRKGALTFFGDYELYGGTGAFITIDAKRIAFKSKTAPGTTNNVLLNLIGKAKY